MAEYIDREKALSTLENTAKYYEMPNADEWTKGIHYGLIHGADNIVDNVPTADVVERDKIDKAIAEIENQKKIIFECDGESDLGIAIQIIRKILGE